MRHLTRYGFTVLALLVTAGFAGTLAAGPSQAAGPNCPQGPHRSHPATCSAAAAPPHGNLVPVTVPQSAQLLIKSIPLGSVGATDVYDPDNNDVYVAAFDIKQVLVVDSATDTILTSIPVGTDPSGINLNPLTNRIYVANQGDGTVSVIDATTNTVITTIGPLPGNLSLGQVGVNPIGNKAYAIDHQANKVFIIDGATNTLKTTLTLPGTAFDSASGITYDPTNDEIYVSSYSNSEVDPIDGATDTLLPPIVTSALCTGPTGNRYDPANNAVYVSNFNGGNICLIDPTTNTLEPTDIEQSNESEGSNFGADPSVNRILANDRGNGFVSLIDTTANTPLVQVYDGSVNIITPTGNTVNPFAHKDYVPDDESDMLNVIGGYAPPAAITAPSKTCNGTSCTLTLTNPLPYKGTLVDSVVSPSGTTLTGCTAAAGSGLVCGQPLANGSLVIECLHTTCPSGAAVALSLSAAVSSALTEQVFIGGQTFTVTPQIVTAQPVMPPPVETAPTKRCNLTVPPTGQIVVCNLTLASALGPTSHLTDTLASPSGATITSCSATGGLVCEPVGANATSVQIDCPGPSSCAAGATVTLGISSTTPGSLIESVVITPAGFLAQRFTVNPSPSVSFAAASKPAPTQSCNGQVIPLSQLCPSPVQQPTGPQPLPVVIPFPPGLT